MLSNKLDAVKEAVRIAQAAVLKLAATVPSSKDSKKFMKFSSKAVDSILQSINASLPEAELVYLSDAMIHVCSAIKILAFSPDLAQITFAVY